MTTATCPTSPDHKTFVTVAHVSEDWLVDEHGNFIYTIGNAGEIVAKPNPGNAWTCDTCGADAEFTAERDAS